MRTLLVQTAVLVEYDKLTEAGGTKLSGQRAFVAAASALPEYGALFVRGTVRNAAFAAAFAPGIMFCWDSDDATAGRACWRG